MATKKKLLQAAAGSAGGAASLFDVTDVFSTYLYDGTGSTNTISNGIALADGFTAGGDGNSVFFDGSNDYLQLPSSSDFAFGTGDFTVEMWTYRGSSSASDNGPILWSHGADNSAGSLWFSWYGDTFYFRIDGLSNDITITPARPTLTWAHVAVTRESGTVRIFINGVLEASGTRTQNITQQAPRIGYTADGGSYHNGYMANVHVVKGTALYTSSFTPSVSPVTAVANTVLITCQGASPLTDLSSSNHTITVNGCVAGTEYPKEVSSDGGAILTKRRDSSSGGGAWFNDTERGITKYISTSSTSGETNNSGGVSSVNSSGYTLGTFSGWNNSAGEYVSWTFRKVPKFFDIITYVGDRTQNAENTLTLNHNLGSTPGMIIVKCLDDAQSWAVYHRSLTTGNNVFLNLTSASGNYNDFPSDPTSTTFTVGSDSRVNFTGRNYVAYLFAHNDGDGEFGPDGDQDIIKCGSYTGNGTSQNFVNLGFEPQWVIVKNISQGGTEYENWFIFDSMRGMFVDGLSDEPLYANEDLAEGGAAGSYAYPYITPRPTGFTLDTGGSSQTNRNGSTFIYIAIRRGPLYPPQSATEIFDLGYLYGSQSNPGFSSNTVSPVDLAFRYYDVPNYGDSYKPWLTSRLTGQKQLLLSTNEVEASNNGNLWDYMNGHRDSAASDYYYYLWKRAPKFLDVLEHVGTGSTQTISHNLGVVPEMIWVKRRTGGTGSWAVYHKDLGNGKAIHIDQTAGDFNAGWWNSTTPTETSFTVGTSEDTVNGSGFRYVSYLFATLDGISKVGSYTGTGSTINVDCGFNSGARFVIIKRIDSSSPWWTWDTGRGIVSGNESWFELNSTVQQTSGYDWIDPNSSGFSVPSGGNTNVSGGTYIFYAIA